MSQRDFPTTAVERYDKALSRGRVLSPVPSGQPEPQPTAAWPAENVALLERYLAWLVEGGAAQSVIAYHRIPMAGHVLGLNLKPHDQLDLDADLEKAMTYIQAKELSAARELDYRHALNWFRRFLRQERGLVAVDTAQTFGNAARYQEGLPAWLLEQMEKYLQLRQANWRPARLATSTYQFWQKYTRVWRWLFQDNDIDALTDINRNHLYAYMDEMLAQGYAPSSVNLDLYAFQSVLRFLQQRGFAMTPSLLTLSGLKKTDSLPRFLTDDQVRQIRDDLVARTAAAKTPGAIRDSRLDMAAFYLLWQGGLRVCELEDLTLNDLYLQQRRVLIRRGKGLKDRTIYLTEAAAAALEAYLAVRGPGNSGHLFLYRHKPISKDLVRSRLKAASQRTGVKVTPHMLRHTFGTQLVNAGCRITTIQMLLGHRRLNSTMIYARVHDETVAQDYYAAMAVIEKQFDLQPTQISAESERSQWRDGGKGQRLLALVDALAESTLDDRQLQVVDELRNSILAMAV